MKSILRAKRLRRWSLRAGLLASITAVAGFALWPHHSAGATFTVTHTGDVGAGSLRQAIEDANNAGAGNHVINFALTSSDTITLGDILDNIKVNIVIDGNGATIDAGGQRRIFFVETGDVTIKNLTLAQGYAKGGDGGSAGSGGGGGGGLGAGGAIFVDSGANVTVQHVAFDQNQARGGSGGDASNGPQGGGGGGGLGGNGGSGGASAGGGGGGFYGNGGSAASSNAIAGAGGGGLILDGGNSSGNTAGAGGLLGGDGGTSGFPGEDGQTFGGGGGGGDSANGGNGGDFGGGGGGGFGESGGDGGFGGGAGGTMYDGGNGGNGLGGAIFVRTGGTLTVEDSQFTNGGVQAGPGGIATPGTDGADGEAHGSGVYLMNGTELNFSVDASGQIEVQDTIGGDGSVRKLGAGELILSGNNNYSGGTVIDAGRLAINGSQTTNVTVNAGGELGGTGTITGNVTNDGIVAPGNSIGTLNINGDYTQNANSELEIEIDPTTNDKLVVDGDVFLNGGTVVVKAAPGTYTNGQQYVFLTYTGTLIGTFDGITDDLAFFDAVLQYNAGDVAFLLQANGSDFVAVAGTFNQYNVGAYLDQNFGGPLQPLIDDMLMMTNDQVQSSLDQLSGAVYGSSVQSQLQTTTSQMQMLAQHLRPDVAGGGFGLAGGAGAINVQVAYADGELTIRGQSESLPQRAAWGTGYGLGGSARNDGNATGLDYALGGVQVGIDHWLDEGTLLGVYGGYSYAQLDGNQLTERVQANSGQTGLYYRRDDGLDYYLVATGVSFDTYKSTRTITFAGETATGNYDGWQSATYLERGRTHRIGAGVLQPYAALQYIYLRQNSFSETGGGVANLDVAGVDASSLRSILGGRASRQFVTAGGLVLVPQIHAGWLHEFLETDSVLNNRFAAVGGNSFTVQGLDLGRDWVIGGGGLSWRITEQLTLAGNYDLQANAHQTFHMGSANVQYVW